MKYKQSYHIFFSIVNIDRWRCSWNLKDYIFGYSMASCFMYELYVIILKTNFASRTFLAPLCNNTKGLCFALSRVIYVLQRTY